MTTHFITLHTIYPNDDEFYLRPDQISALSPYTYLNDDDQSTIGSLISLASGLDFRARENPGQVFELMGKVGEYVTSMIEATPNAPVAPTGAVKRLGIVRGDQ
ncbi:hypothetical protein SEA_PUPPER_16 [Gordonia phage Pupper]|uniref:Uncharacterized protein n=1 Tax=Gordonia phage Pupper TaxID=2571249 RepID=A0A4Y6EIF4_9CAUD|nr:hypothetical protein KHQ83_gp016 [Gordonia phage Pupper]QDF18503.1 hypothetical protein SEA_PUPPER_16 [Gordonia phage Pupper]QDF18736.1 hypothetical protein SEA_SCENTAE_16 [Gordonia phage SCentae]